MRITMLLAAASHILFAVWTNCWPHHYFDLINIPRPNHPMLWRVLGMLVGVLGIAFFFAAKNPIQYWVVVLIGLAKTVIATVFVSLAIQRGDLPGASLYLLFFDDIIWIIPFAMILWASIRAHAGIPPSRNQPYTIGEASVVYRLSDGKTLAEASDEKTLVLVFLRHFGCTFTRQILKGLQDLEKQAKANGAELVLVHMLQSGQEANYLGQKSDIRRIADPRCELYRAFGLGKGGFLELFGPHVWWRGIVAVFKGCGVGHLAGDGLQMPGAFLFHKGSIVAAQPAHTAADLPDLPSLFQNSP